MPHHKQNWKITQAFVQQCRESGIRSLSGGLQEGLAELVEAVERAGGEAGEQHDAAVGEDGFVFNEKRDQCIPENEAEDGENGFEKLFRLIEERKEFFRQYFDTVGPYLSQKERLPELLMEHMDTLVAEMGYETREELEYHQTFFCNGLVAMIQHWLACDCRETPEE